MAWMTPLPSLPAAWNTTSQPLLTRSCAACLPCATLSKLPVYCTSTVAFGLVVFTPARKPASNFLMSGISMPPTKPIFPSLDTRPASAPTRKLPSSSLNTTVRTLGSAMGVPFASISGESMSRNFAPWFCFATVSTAFSSMKPVPTVRSAPWSTTSCRLGW